ncbi:MAG: ABC transporter permease [Pedosphaera sp.]|nr:ABC transporter permease [Pedosphaera sp.]
MNLFNAILIGLKEVWAHKFRSLLTLFGVVLGVASLVGMSAIIKGMENGMRESMIAMGGADKVLLERQAVPTYQEHLADQAPGRTLVDVVALKQGAPLLRVISPEMAVPDAMVSRGDKRASPEECVGVWPEVLEMNLHTVEYGRFFNALDEEKAQAVCVIGTGIRDSLFGDPDEVGREIIPLGETIQINGQPFVIVGMFTQYASEQDLKARALRNQANASTNKVETKKSRGWGRKGGWAFWRKNNTLYIPLNTAWVRFRMAGDLDGIPDPRLSAIDLKVKSMEQMELAIQQAKNVLLVTHRGIEDFTFQTKESEVQNINKQIKNARLSGGIIAGISLLVGGIGIMNIMLASINERVREIGTCKALGATGVDIFVQIIVESVVLSLLGAIAGLAASLLIVDLLSFIAPTGNTPIITWEAQAIAVAFSGSVGVFAGFLPAIKAARLEPIQALRYE